MQYIQDEILGMCLNSEVKNHADVFAVSRNIRIPVFSDSEFEEYLEQLNHPYKVNNREPEYEFVYSLKELRDAFKEVKDKDAMKYKTLLTSSGVDKPKQYLNVFGSEEAVEHNWIWGRSLADYNWHKGEEERCFQAKICIENALKAAENIEVLGFSCELVNSLYISTDWSLESGGRWAELDNKHSVHKVNLEYALTVLGTFANHLRSGNNPRKIILGTYGFNDEEVERTISRYKRVWDSITQGRMYS